MILSEGKKIIHVNRHHIAANAKDGGDRQVYTIKHGGKTTYAREVIIDGPSRLVYNGNQLSCGARAWIETTSPLILVDAATFKEVIGNEHRQRTSATNIGKTLPER